MHKIKQGTQSRGLYTDIWAAHIVCGTPYLTLSLLAALVGNRELPKSYTLLH